MLELQIYCSIPTYQRQYIVFYFTFMLISVDMKILFITKFDTSKRLPYMGNFEIKEYIYRTIERSKFI